MKIASMLGHSFSVVSTGKHSIPNKYAVIRKYNLEGCVVSVRAHLLFKLYAKLSKRRGSYRGGDEVAVLNTVFG